MPGSRLPHVRLPRFSRRRPDRLRDGLVLLVVVAALAAGWFGWSWYQAAHDDGLEFARMRDTVLREATEALDALNSVDYRTAKQDIKRWDRVSTGRFGQELASGWKAQVEQIRKAKIVAETTVVSAAVTALKPHDGRARVMAVLDIEVSHGGKSPQSRYSLVEATLTRTEQGWKVKGVQVAG